MSHFYESMQFRPLITERDSIIEAIRLHWEPDFVLQWADGYFVGPGAGKRANGSVLKARVMGLGDAARLASELAADFRIGAEIVSYGEALARALVQVERRLTVLCAADMAKRLRRDIISGVKEATSGPAS